MTNKEVEQKKEEMERRRKKEEEDKRRKEANKSDEDKQKMKTPSLPLPQLNTDLLPPSLTHLPTAPKDGPQTPLPAPLLPPPDTTSCTSKQRSYQTLRQSQDGGMTLQSVNKPSSGSNERSQKQDAAEVDTAVKQEPQPIPTKDSETPNKEQPKEPEGPSVEPEPQLEFPLTSLMSIRLWRVSRCFPQKPEPRTAAGTSPPAGETTPEGSR
ncbi:proteoglycan 4-like [Pseudochaenichthys georgianus]|uniref:proteoglycan 4-like n=1 Tax=Pseudochaenichthys georgianus TaxID=52239 RepID=UPI0039C0BDB9